MYENRISFTRHNWLTLRYVVAHSRISHVIIDIIKRSAQSCIFAANKLLQSTLAVPLYKLVTATIITVIDRRYRSDATSQIVKPVIALHRNDPGGAHYTSTMWICA